MKKLFFFICVCTCAASFAQDGKPTKEKTIDFLNAYYQRNQSWRSSGTVNVDGIRTFSVNKITSLDSCKLKVEWTFTYRFISRDGSVNDKTDYVAIVDMSKAEEVNFDRRKEENGQHMDYLKFTASPNNNFSESSKGTFYGKVEEISEYKSEVSIPLGTSWSDLSEEEIKVRKAFNHLRKLCDAPDPISFD